MKPLLSFFFLCLYTYSWGQNGYDFSFEIEGYHEKKVYLAYYYGDKQYLLDSVPLDSKGLFRFRGDEMLKSGIYLLVLPPDNTYLQFLMVDGQQHFKAKTAAKNPTENMIFEGVANENRRFYSYLNYLSWQRTKSASLQKIVDSIKASEGNFQKQENELNTINEEVMAYQQDIIEKEPDSYTAAIIKANLGLTYPEFTGTTEEQNMKRWQYTKKHYFDSINLGDPRMLRTPFLYERIRFYIEELQIKQPDSISKAIDEVLHKMEPSPETYKFYLSHFLNTYAQSNIVGMDAVYVHLALNYFATGKAPWTEKEQLDKIVKNAKQLDPILIGKKGPNLVLEKGDGSKLSLYDIDSPYTIMFIWDPECGHCKKAIQPLKNFYAKYKDKGVAILAICMRFGEEVGECWKYINENNLTEWLHVVDPYHRSKFSDVYNVKSTPSIYVFDKNKIIISKRIGVEQLEEVIDYYLQKGQ